MPAPTAVTATLHTPPNCVWGGGAALAGCSTLLRRQEAAARASGGGRPPRAHVAAARAPAPSVPAISCRRPLAAGAVGVWLQPVHTAAGPRAHHVSLHTRDGSLQRRAPPHALWASVQQKRLGQVCGRCTQLRVAAPRHRAPGLAAALVACARNGVAGLQPGVAHPSEASQATLLQRRRFVMAGRAERRRRSRAARVARRPQSPPRIPHPATNRSKHASPGRSARAHPNDARGRGRHQASSAPLVALRAAAPSTASHVCCHPATTTTIITTWSLEHWRRECGPATRAGRHSPASAHIALPTLGGAPPPQQHPPPPPPPPHQPHPPAHFISPPPPPSTCGAGRRGAGSLRLAGRGGSDGRFPQALSY